METKRKSENTLRQWPWKHNDMKSVHPAKSSLKREVCSNKRISLKKKTNFKKQPNLPPRITRKRGTNRVPNQQRMGLIKIREVINREHKNNRKDQQTMSWFFEKKSKIDKCLVRLTKNNTERTQNRQSEKWKREIINTTEILFLSHSLVMAQGLV